jgi:hypothetical protein
MRKAASTGIDADRPDQRARRAAGGRTNGTRMTRIGRIFADRSAPSALYFIRLKSLSLFKQRGSHLMSAKLAILGGEKLSR